MKPSTRALVLSAIVAAIVSVAMILLLGRAGVASSPLQHDKAYARIEASKTIRAAYAVGAPLFIIDPVTKAKSGIFHDLVEEAATRLGLKVDWSQEVGYGEMIEGLNAGRYDIVGSGVWINSDRARGADFTSPVYYDAVYAYSRAGDRRFSNITVLNSSSFKIATMDGELGATIAQADFPNAQTLSLPQNSDFSLMIENVVARKADVVFLSAGAANDYLAVHPGALERVQDRPLRIFPNSIMIPQGEQILRDQLNVALAEMLNDGTVEKILKKYEKVSGTFLRLPLPYEPLPSQ